MPGRRGRGVAGPAGPADEPAATCPHLGGPQLPEGPPGEPPVPAPEPTAPRKIRTPNPWLGRLITFNFVTFGWILFRSETFTDAWDYVRRMFTAWGRFDRGVVADRGDDRGRAGGAVPAP